MPKTRSNVLDGSIPASLVHIINTYQSKESHLLMRGVARAWGAGIAESGWGVGWKRDRELFCELVAIHFYVNI